jgi:hypothetical protein
MDRETQEISIRLESYDDIFSDFDIRPYSKRALSVDFLDEIKRASTDKSEDGIELSIHVPLNTRDNKEEATISERLRRHFKRHYDLLVKQKRRIIKNGLYMSAFGISFLAVVAFILSQNNHDLLFSFLLSLLEPAAVFLLWEGMELIFFKSKDINHELNFYRKMNTCEISYVSYDEKIQSQLGVYYH